MEEAPEGADTLPSWDAQLVRVGEEIDAMVGELAKAMFAGRARCSEGSRMLLMLLLPLLLRGRGFC